MSGTDHQPGQTGSAHSGSESSSRPAERVHNRAAGEIDKPASVGLGEGLPPIPTKLVAKIKWEYIDMLELLPELWPAQWEMGRQLRSRSR